MLEPATRIRVFIDPDDIAAARQAVLSGPTSTTPAYIADVAEHIAGVARQVRPGVWHASEYAFATTCAPLDAADSLVLDAYIDHINKSVGLLLHGWADYQPTRVVSATTEDHFETARVIIANMDTALADSSPLWGPQADLVPGKDINLDALLASNRRIARTLDPFYDIERARVIGELEHASSTIMHSMNPSHALDTANQPYVHNAVFRPRISRFGGLL